MVNQVSGDKVLSQGSSRSSGLEERRVERQQRDATDESSAKASASDAPVTDDSLQVSRAGELFSQDAARPGRSTGGIETAEQATALASRILQQFQESPDQAFRAQAGERVDQYAYLLQTAPV